MGIEIAMEATVATMSSKRAERGRSKYFGLVLTLFGCLSFFRNLFPISQSSNRKGLLVVSKITKRRKESKGNVVSGARKVILETMEPMLLRMNVMRSEVTMTLATSDWN